MKEIRLMPPAQLQYVQKKPNISRKTSHVKITKRGKSQDWYSRPPLKDITTTHSSSNSHSPTIQSDLLFNSCATTVQERELFTEQT